MLQRKVPSKEEVEKSGRQAGAAETVGSGGVLGRPCTDSDAEFGAKMSETGSCGLFIIFLGAMKSPHGRGGGFLVAHYVL